MASAAGVNFSKSPVMSVTRTNCPAVTATPLSRQGAGGRQRRDLHGQQVVGRRVVGIAEAEVASGERVGRVFQRRDRVVWCRRRVVDGVTLIVIVLGDGSRSTPPLAVPPSSCTWKVKLAYGRAVGVRPAGVNFSNPPVMSASGMNCPAVTATPLSSACRQLGSVVISTASRLLAGVSFGSLKPKSADGERVSRVLQTVVIVLSVPIGGVC